jgi:hypothetical protein
MQNIADLSLTGKEDKAAGVIKDDSQKYVKSISHEFYIDRENARVEVEICEAREEFE